MITRRLPLALILLLLLLALLAWSPWLSADFARQRAESAFSAGWQGVADGCGLNCKGCGAVQAGKTWFGYRVTVEYACGLLPADSPQYHRRAEGFVSFLGTVHSLPGQ